MKMHRNKIREYLSALTTGAGASNPDPMAEMRNYYLDALAMRRDAEADGNLEWLRLSMDALIANPAGRIGQFAGQLYPFSEEELVQIFTYAYGIVWPDHELSEPGSELDLEFVVMSDEEWADLTSA